MNTSTQPDPRLDLAGATITLGGFTGFLPEEWQQRLQADILRRFPLAQPLVPSTDWHSNDCIFTALQKVLFHQFGILLPDDSIFKLYNPDGEGLSADYILEAVGAVVTPAGVRVRRVVVANPVLRAAVGQPPLVAGPEACAEMDGRPGVCMIQIEPGHSHAFFWERMDGRAVSSPQFRMAVLLAGRDRPAGALLVSRAVADYGRLVFSALAQDPAAPTYHQLTGALDDLLDCADRLQIHPQASDCPLLVALVDQVDGLAGGALCGRSSPEARAALHAPVLLRRIILDSAVLA